MKQTRAPTRGHVAHLLGMKTVTPRAIAYVAVQVSWSLSGVWHVLICASCVSLFQMLQHGMRMMAASAIPCSTIILWIFLKLLLGPLLKLEPVTCCCGGHGNVNTSLVFFFPCLISIGDRKVFGGHSFQTVSNNRPGSSVSKLASQRAARESARVSSC